MMVVVTCRSLFVKEKKQRVAMSWTGVWRVAVAVSRSTVLMVNDYFSNIKPRILCIHSTKKIRTLASGVCSKVKWYYCAAGTRQLGRRQTNPDSNRHLTQLMT